MTRGTTNPNRLRRQDRWLTGPQAWRLRRSDDPPIVVDLGYGASPVTAVELHDRLRRVRPDVRTVGIEIEASRVAQGRELLAHNPGLAGLSFRRGGFEIPLDAGFGSIGPFNRAFKAAMGCTPTAYRARFGCVAEERAQAGLEVFKEKLIRRDISLKAFDAGEVQDRRGEVDRRAHRIAARATLDVGVTDSCRPDRRTRARPAERRSGRRPRSPVCRCPRPFGYSGVSAGGLTLTASARCLTEPTRRRRR